MWSRIASSSPRRRSFSASLRPRRARVATWSTSARERVMERLLSRPLDLFEREPGQHGLLGRRESGRDVCAECRLVVTSSPDAGEGHVAGANQLHRLGHEASSDALASLAGPDVELRDLRLETGSRVEEHDPAEPDRLAARRPGNEDVVLAGESRCGAEARAQLLRALLGMVVVPLLREGEVDEHRSNVSVLVILEGFDADVIEICHGQ